ncbi:MAG: DUF3817 domain-containing protein [Sulfurovum sp.]|nr:DUF3817 domain-containing protein [Sulfurovum sp.]
MSELKKFRIINKIEGYSYLILLFIAMPLKYAMGYPVATKIAGMIHGLLFIAFVYQLLEAKTQMQFDKKETAIYFILSLIPFGSFYTDKMLKQKYSAALERVQA